MSEESNEPFLKERQNVKSENNRKYCVDDSVKLQQPDVEKSAEATGVIIESDDKPFIYDVHENPPILMTIFFAMQVCYLFFLLHVFILPSYQITIITIC